MHPNQQPDQYPDQPYGYYEPTDQPVPPVSPGPYPPYLPQQPYPAPTQVTIVNQPSKPTSPYAIIGLIFSILGLVSSCCTFGVFSFVGVVCALAAMRETNNDAKGGRSMAIVALVLGGLGLVFPIFFFVSGVTGNLINPTPTPTP
jgi:hypothetical protein